MKTKICPNCKEKKDINLFVKRAKAKDGFDCYCKECKNKKRRDYYKNNKKRVLEVEKKYYNKNKKKIKQKTKTYYEKNREKIIGKKKIEYQGKKEQKREYNRLYYIKNKTELNKKNKIRAEENKEKYKKAREKYKPIRNRLLNERRERDLDFKIKQDVKSSFLRNLKQKGKDSFYVYSGIERKEYINHLKKDPLWSRYEKKEKINIDHIVPISIYDFLNKNDIKKCWNPLNLRLLSANDNLKKSNKVDFNLIKKYKIEHLLPEGFKKNEN